MFQLDRGLFRGILAVRRFELEVFLLPSDNLKSLIKRLIYHARLLGGGLGSSMIPSCNAT